jgi:predicted transcriptional regulator
LFAHENEFEKSYIAKLVRGEVEPKLGNMVRLAKALDATLEDLYPMKKRRK